MQKFKFTLLAATAIAGSVASPVCAQAVIAGVGNYAIPAPGLPVTTTTVNGTTYTYDGDVALHGAGSTAVQNVIDRVFNCLGTPYELGNGQPGQSGSLATTGSLAAKTPGVYAGTGAAAAPAVTCNNESANVNYSGGTSTYEVQPVVTGGGATYGYAAKYVGTGSGFGRKIWYWGSDVFNGGASSNAVSGVYNPFNLVSGDNRWSHVQYAFSDAPLAASELAIYNGSGNAVTFGGPAIQFPLFVVPIAISYDSEYGINKSKHPMTFNTQYTGNFNGTTISSLRLSAQAYCSIFNGDITNWNDAQLTGLNKRVALYDPVNDTAARWAADGVPIRLVGRMDNSGSTDIFTRHLAAVCSQSGIYAPVNNPANVNKYLNHAESLPYNASQNGGVDYTTVRSDVNYKPSAPASKFAGTTNTVSGDYFTGSLINNLNPGTTISAAPTGYTGSGLYIVANGGGNLAKAIVFAPDYPAADGTTLNGKIGYISADYVQPSIDSPGGLVAAQLSVSGSAPFIVPTIKNGLTAFGTVVPPESDATGAYKPGTDTRTVSSGTTTRGNPLAWTDILYQSGVTLANPASGYPITGTTQYFGYSCYATNGNRQAIAELLGTLLGQIKVDASGAKFGMGTFNSATPATPGIVDQSNLGIVPKPWQFAITNTFLTAAGDAKAANLWFTSALLPTFTKAKTTKGVTTPGTTTQPTANSSTCSTLTGA